MTGPLPRLSAAQAAARLGVRPETLYAYVSRGLLSRERTAHGSSFDPLEIEAFASRRGARSQGGRASSAGGMPLMVLDTAIAAIEDGELYFRGVPVSELAHGASYESVVRWLWTEHRSGGSPPEGPAEGPTESPETAGLAGDPEAVASARAALAVLPASASPLDRIQVAVPVLAVSDATRHDLAADSVRAAGARLIGGIVAALGPPPPVPDRTVSRLLWTALAGRRPTPQEDRAMNAALVLLVDHDLAVSTLAARAAASARATPYAVVSSGLGALDAGAHGNASGAAHELIHLVLDGADARGALAHTASRGGLPTPGFGQPLYPGVDARARILLPIVATLPHGRRVVGAVDRLAAEVAALTGRHPNVDLALAALTSAAGMPAAAGAAVFAVARMAGWIAHALEEYTQPPLRLRPRGRYTGPAPRG